MNRQDPGLGNYGTDLGQHLGPTDSGDTNTRRSPAERHKCRNETGTKKPA